MLRILIKKFKPNVQTGSHVKEPCKAQERCAKPREKFGVDLLKMQPECLKSDPFEQNSSRHAQSLNPLPKVQARRSKEASRKSALERKKWKRRAAAAPQENKALKGATRGAPKRGARNHGKSLRYKVLLV